VFALGCRAAPHEPAAKSASPAPAGAAVQTAGAPPPPSLDAGLATSSVPCGRALSLPCSSEDDVQPASCSYRVVDIMPSFWEFWARAEKADRATQLRLMKEMVVARYPEVYTPEVIGVAPGRTLDESLTQGFGLFMDKLAPHVPTMRRLSTQIASDLPRFQQSFRRLFPDLCWTGTVYYLASLGGFDGATREVDGKTALMFGIDMIAFVHGSRANLEPLFHHELFHLYHRQFDPPGSAAEDEAAPVLWGLWGEGLAVYASKVLHPKATNAELLMSDALVEQTRRVLPALVTELRAKLASTSMETYRDFFLGNGKRTDVPKRAGYYVGLLVAEEVAKTREWKELVRLRGEPLRAAVDDALGKLEPSKVRKLDPTKPR